MQNVLGLHIRLDPYPTGQGVPEEHDMSESNVITKFPWGTLENHTAAFFVDNPYEGDLKPGDIVQIGFGDQAFFS